MNSLKLLTNLQKDGDSPAESIVTGSREECREGIMDGLGKFIEVDNHEALNVDGLRKVVKPRFAADFPDIREGAEALLLRAAEVGARRTFIDTTRVEDKRWRPPLVDADWHSVKPFAKESQDRNGKRCIMITRICIRRWEPRSLERIKRQGLYGP